MKTNETFRLKDFFRAILTLALPIALQNLLSTTASMVDTIMIGSLSELTVAAVGTCSQIIGMINSCYSGFVAGSPLFFAQYWGDRDIRNLNKTFGLTFSISMFIVSSFTLMAVFHPEFLLRIYTDKQNIIQEAVPYLRTVSLSLPVSALSLLTSYFLRTTERVKVPLISSLVSVGINMLMNWILIYGRFGFPQLGAKGAAVATLISSLTNLAFLLVYVLISKSEARLKLKRMFGWSTDFIGLYFKKVTPVLCNDMFYGLGMMIVNIVIGRQSETAIAAMTSFRVLEGFVFAFSGGMSNSASVVVGKDVGMGNHMRAYRSARAYAVICPIMTFCIIGTGCLFSEQLFGLFGLSDQGIAYGRIMLLIYLAAGTCRICNFIMNDCFRAAGDPVFGTVLEICGLYLVSVPAVVISGLVLKLPFLAVFAFVYTDELIRLAFELRHTYSCKWIKPVTESGRATLEAFHQEISAKRRKK